MAPPQGRRQLTAFVRWLYDLIRTGQESATEEERAARPSLGIASSIQKLAPGTMNRGLAALRRVGELLRSLLWAERAGLVREETTFSEFFRALSGAIEEATYVPRPGHNADGIFVGDVVQSREVPFRAAAVLGLSEELFPAVLEDDPFLTHAVRRWLNAVADFRLDSPLESNEQEYFYETVTRPSERLLLTRPRLADTGGLWQSSPFWQEIERLVAIKAERRNDPLPMTPSHSASDAEWLEAVARYGIRAAEARLPQATWARWQGVKRSANLFRHRYEGRKDDHDGRIPAVSPVLADHFGPHFRWSASQLELYQLCPFFFFIANVLGLETRAEPSEGLDARQLGSLYHQNLEEVYQRTPPALRDDAGALQERLVTVGEAILDQAPQREGFRATAWWRQTRDEILEDLRRTVEALSDLPSEYRPSHFEISFGNEGSPEASAEDEAFLLRGIIDSVDVDHRGRLRLIDYKTAGPYDYTARAHEEGKKLQLPLYAAAAQRALKVGEVENGFYWHVRHAEASPFTLADYGVQEAIDSALSHAWTVVRKIRGR